MLVDRQRLGQAKVSQLDRAGVIDETRPACDAGRKGNEPATPGVYSNSKNILIVAQTISDATDITKVCMMLGCSGMALTL